MTDFITPLLSAQADDLFNSILAKEEKMNLFKGIKKKIASRSVFFFFKYFPLLLKYIENLSSKHYSGCNGGKCKICAVAIGET